MIKLLYGLKAFHQSQNLDDFLLACKADKKGRLGFEDLQYPEMELWQECFAVAATITAQILIDRGLETRKKSGWSIASRTDTGNRAMEKGED